MTFECCKKCVFNGCCSCQSDNNYASCNDVFQELIKKIEQLEKKKQKVIALIKDGRFVEALQELEGK